MDEEKGYALYALDVAVDGTRIAKNRHRINTLLTFRSNSARIPKDRLLIQILFYPENIEITPDTLVFEPCRQGEPMVRTLLLKHGEGKDFTVSEAASSTPFLTTAVMKKGQGEAEIRVTLDEHAPLGILRAEIRLVIDYNKHLALFVPVLGRVLPREGGEAPKNGQGEAPDESPDDDADGSAPEPSGSASSSPP
jgi:hypothetical protein